MKKQILFIVTFVIAFSHSFAQTYESFNDIMRNKKMADFIFKDDYSEVEGSPYENDEFIEGKAVAHTDANYENVAFRLNIYNDQVEFKNNNGEILAIANPDYFKYFEFGNLKIQYLPYYEGNKTLKGFFKVIEEGEATLLLKPKVNYYEATEPGAYRDAEPAKFKRMPDKIFIKTGKEPATEISNKKSLISALSDKEGQINSYLKKNKIKISDPDDIIKVLKYYNSN